MSFVYHTNYASTSSFLLFSFVVLLLTLVLSVARRLLSYRVRGLANRVAIRRVTSESLIFLSCVTFSLICFLFYAISLLLSVSEVSFLVTYGSVIQQPLKILQWILLCCGVLAGMLALYLRRNTGGLSLEQQLFSADALALMEAVPPAPLVGDEIDDGVDENLPPANPPVYAPVRGVGRDLGHIGGRRRLHGGHFISSAADAARCVFGLPADNRANRRAVEKVVIKWMQNQLGARNQVIADSYPIAVEMVFTPKQAHIDAAAYRRSDARGARVCEYNRLVSSPSNRMPETWETRFNSTYVPVEVPEF
jgi:uncharacterized protein with PQ loop repeat